MKNFQDFRAKILVICMKIKKNGLYRRVQATKIKMLPVKKLPPKPLDIGATRCLRL